MSLETIIKERIRAKGPITVAEYMTLALSHPDYGYYMHKDPLGAAGDFITAPEISQVFGELIGAWLAAQWLIMGSPEAMLVELGPGRGTLMKDALRATRGVQGFHEAITVHLVETSPALKAKQQGLLAGAHPSILWHDYIDDLPEKPLLLIANEFFDALPIRQYVYLAGGWKERFITVENDRLQFTIPADAGRLIERAEFGKEWAARIGHRLKAQGGAALIIDYGYAYPPKQSNETLQAVRDHAYHEVLTDPGSADLTAHVDFHAVAQAAIEEGAAAHDPISQAQFLMRLGAAMRTALLCEHASDAQKSAMLSGLERLLSPDEMGDLFKVLCLTHPDHPKPEGF